MTKENVYRDIIYFDTNKVQSILVQIHKGLINNMLESKSSNHEGEANVNTDKLMNLLLPLPISTGGGYTYTRSKGLQEEKSLHDFALTELLNTLALNDVTSLKREAFSNKK